MTSPAPGASVRVASIAALLSTLADDTVGDIVVANGTYHISPASSHASDSLYIGSRFAGRTRPVTVRAETIGGVTFDGGGGTSYMGMAFEQGAHDQTWDGFNFANMVGTPIEFGGFTPSAPAHHITLRHITLKSTCLRASASSNQEQGIYFSNAAGSGPHDILLEDVTVDGTNPNSVWSAIHAYHGDPADPPASRVTIRRLTVTGTTNGIVLWNDTAIQHDWLIEDSTISGARDTAIRFESIGAQNIVFDAITSSGSEPVASTARSARTRPVSPSSTTACIDALLVSQPGDLPSPAVTSSYNSRSLTAFASTSCSANTWVLSLSAAAAAAGRSPSNATSAPSDGLGAGVGDEAPSIRDPEGLGCRRPPSRSPEARSIRPRQGLWANPLDVTAGQGRLRPTMSRDLGVRSGAPVNQAEPHFGPSWLR